jgi:hypothetical protein
VLALHGTKFGGGDGDGDGDGRTINVMQANDRNGEAKKNLTPAQANKHELSAAGMARVDALVASHVASGVLRDGDFDQRATDFLHSVPETIAVAAINDFVELDLSRVGNRCASHPLPSAPTEPPRHALALDYTLSAIRCTHKPLPRLRSWTSSGVH